MTEQEFSLLLDKFRDEEAAPLSFEPSIDRLINDQYCKNFDEIIHGSGCRWERRRAVEGLGPMLPEERGLYMFVWSPQFVFRFASHPEAERLYWVLYVGKAGIEHGTDDTLRNRYQAEYRKYVGGNPSELWKSGAPLSREQRLSRYLALRPLEYWFLCMTDTRDISIFERKLLRLLRPPLNTQLGPRVRLGKTGPAF